MRLGRLLERGVQPELAGVLQVARHERVAEGRLHGSRRARHGGDLRGENVAPNHFVQTLDCTAKCHGRARYASHWGKALLICLRGLSGLMPYRSLNRVPKVPVRCVM